MIDSISEYTYIRDTMFGDGPRVKIDESVLGNRDQSRIKRNVDQFYLKEVSKTWGSSDLPNSVEFGFPINWNEGLPVPDTSSMVDPEKFSKFSLGGSDTYMWSGEEDPDYEELREQLADALDEKNSKVAQAQEKCSGEVEKASTELTNKTESIRERRTSLTEERNEIVRKYNDDMRVVESEFASEMDSIRTAREDLTRRYASGAVSRSEYESGMHDLDEDEYDARVERINSSSRAFSEFSSSSSRIGNGLYQCVIDEVDADKEYKDAVSTASEERSTATKAAEDAFNDISTGIFTDSNGYVGDPTYPKYRKALEDISKLSIYKAHENVQKAVPWIPKSKESTYVEYNDRLMAVWDKCRIISISVNAERTVRGFMESYNETGEYPDWEEGKTYTLTTSFKRWHDSDNTIYFAEEWGSSGGASAVSTFEMGSPTFKFRFGNRHQMGKASSIKIALYFVGSGEDGIGRIYGLVDATRQGIAQEGYVVQLDAEDDLHLKNMQDIEDEFSGKMADLELEHNANLEDILASYDENVKELRDRYEADYRSAQASFVQGLEGISITANTKKMKGEDNSSELQVISDAKVRRSEDISKKLEKLAEDISSLAADREENISAENERYSEEISDTSSERAEDIEEENERHSDAIDEIMNAYENERRAFIEEAEKSRDDEIDAADKELESYQKSLAEQREQFGQSCVNQWNSRHPEAPLPEGFDPWTDPLPGSQQEIEEIFTRPMWDFTKSRQQPTNDAFDARDTARANAYQKYAQKMSEWDDLDLNAREVWTFSAGAFQGYGGNFKSSRGEGKGGQASVRDLLVIGAWADMDYRLTTGAEHKDYEKEDEK